VLAEDSSEGWKLTPNLLKIEGIVTCNCFKAFNSDQDSNNYKQMRWNWFVIMVF